MTAIVLKVSGCSSERGGCPPALVQEDRACL